MANTTYIRLRNGGYITAWNHDIPEGGASISVNDLIDLNRCDNMLNNASPIFGTENQISTNTILLDQDLRIIFDTDADSNLRAGLYIGLTRKEHITLIADTTDIGSSVSGIYLVCDRDSITDDLTEIGFLTFIRSPIADGGYTIRTIPASSDATLIQHFEDASKATEAPLVDTIAGRIVWTKYSTSKLSLIEQYTSDRGLFYHGNYNDGPDARMLVSGPGASSEYRYECDAKYQDGFTYKETCDRDVVTVSEPEPTHYTFDSSGSAEFLNDMCTGDSPWIQLLGTDLLNDRYTSSLSIEYSGAPVTGTGIYLEASGYFYGLINYNGSYGVGMVKVDGTEAPHIINRGADGTYNDNYTLQPEHYEIEKHMEHLYVTKLEHCPIYGSEDTGMTIGFIEVIRCKVRGTNNSHLSYVHMLSLVHEVANDSINEASLKDKVTQESIEETVPDPRVDPEPAPGPSEDEQEQEEVEEETSTDNADQRGDQGGDADYEKSRENTPINTAELPSDSSAVQYMNIIGDSLRVYRPESTDLMGLFTSMQNSTIIDKIKTYIQADPMNFINSLHIVPGTLPTSKLTTNKVNITIAGQTLTYDVSGVTTNVQMKRVKNSLIDGVENAGNIIEIDYEPITLSKYPGGFPDYEHTPMEIYLPFIGYRPLDARDVWDVPDKTSNPDGEVELSLKYFIDVIFGTCTAILYKGATATTPELGTDYYDIIGQWQGVCRMDIPITSTRYTNVMGSVIGALGSLTSLGVGVATANPTAIAGGVLGTATAGASLLSSANNPSVTNRDANSTNGWYQCKVPYIKIYRPNPTLSKGFSHVTGWAYKVSATVGSFTKTKFVKFSKVHWDENTPPNMCKDEMDKIEEYLMGGVYR